MDSGIVAGLVQAGATVVAVVIGYGLSVLNDRAARKRERGRESRERQLQAIVDALEALATVRGSWLRLSGVFSSTVAAGTMRSATESALAVSDREAQIRSLGGDISRSSDAVATLERLALKFQVLRMDESANCALKDAVAAARGAYEEMSRASRSVGELSAAHGKSLDESLSQLTSAGQMYS